MTAMKRRNPSNVVDFKESNLLSIRQDIQRLFQEFGDPISNIKQEDILDYISFLDRDNRTPSEIRKSWRNAALFLLFMIYQPEYKFFHDLKPWEFSLFLTDFLSEDFLRGSEDRFAFSRDVFNTLQDLFLFLKEKGQVKNLANLLTAKKMIFKNGKIYRLRRPPPSWNEVVMTAENPVNGARYHFTLGDYWLILVREIDFEGNWHKMIDFLKSNKVPSRDQKLKLIQRLMEISRDANVDSYELVYHKPSSREISKAERHFFEDDL
jgi:hypothetical protein